MRDKEQEWNQADADHDAELAEMQDKIEREGKPDSEAKPQRKKAEYTCKGCGFPVAYEGDYCGECICEEDGL